MWILNGNTETPVSLPRVMEEKRTLEDGTETQIMVSTSDLTVEAWDRLGYNEAIPHSKGDPFTEYETEWSKDDDLIYREKVITFSIDEVAKAEMEKTQQIAKIKCELAELDTYVPRGLEDLLTNPNVSANVSDLSEWNKTRYNRKQELRAELALL